ncbi:MAG: helix-turn-helix transcriptional regulator [Fibrobacteres bacterium]|nr:helix-turn-helix transcriptional regulator [Fibrobacterota bacterium]
MINKARNPLIGIEVLACHHRERYRTLHYDKKLNSASVSFTLNFVTQGILEVCKNDKSFLVRPKGVHIWAPGEAMVLKPYKSPLSYFVFEFTPYIKNTEALKVEDIGFQPMFTAAKPKIVQRYLKQLEAIFNEREPNRLTRSSIVATSLILALQPDADSSRRFPERPDNRDSFERLDDALAYIHRNYKLRISVKTLAEIASMPVSNFIIAFREKTGLTPHRYLMQLKLEKAKDFLRFFRDTPPPVAAELGFHDYSHFFRLFKRYTGKSPSRFRKEVN